MWSDPLRECLFKPPFKLATKTLRAYTVYEAYTSPVSRLARCLQGSLVMANLPVRLHFLSALHAPKYGQVYLYLSPNSTRHVCAVLQQPELMATILDTTFYSARYSFQNKITCAKKEKPFTCAVYSPSAEAEKLRGQFWNKHNLGKSTKSRSHSAHCSAVGVGVCRGWDKNSMRHVAERWPVGSMGYINVDIRNK